MTGTAINATIKILPEETDVIDANRKKYQLAGSVIVLNLQRGLNARSQR
jgi:hypothetical protein